MRVPSGMAVAVAGSGQEVLMHPVYQGFPDRGMVTSILLEAAGIERAVDANAGVRFNRNRFAVALGNEVQQVVLRDRRCGNVVQPLQVGVRNDVFANNACHLKGGKS